MAYLATVRHCHWTCTCVQITPCTHPPCSQVEEKLTCMFNDQRRGDNWKLNDLRALLFGHYARESKATSSPLAVDGFTAGILLQKEKLQKMQKVQRRLELFGP